MTGWKKYTVYAVAAGAGWALAGFADKACAAVSTGLALKDATHQMKVAQGVTLFRFSKQGGCEKGEFAVALADSTTQTVTFGCAHPWGPNHYINFEDGDFGALGQHKWQPIGKEL